MPKTKTTTTKVFPIRAIAQEMFNRINIDKPSKKQWTNFKRELVKVYRQLGISTTQTSVSEQSYLHLIIIGIVSTQYEDLYLDEFSENMLEIAEHVCDHFDHEFDEWKQSINQAIWLVMNRTGICGGFPFGENDSIRYIEVQQRSPFFYALVGAVVDRILH